MFFSRHSHGKHTLRGRSGGLRLKRDPSDIHIGQVVRDTEDRLDVIGCLGERGYCWIERVCVLRGALREATDAFLAVLDLQLTFQAGVELAEI